VLLSQLLTPQRIRVPIVGTDKASILRELVEAVADGDTGQVEDLLEAVREREAVLSTGVGYGVALPHGRSAGVDELRVSAGVAPGPIPYDSLDGEPVRLFFLLIGPESEAGAHVKALSRITRLVRQLPLRERLLQAASAEEFHRHLREAEGL
jgi:mannitol/fructose-specific phosphotransferase system IIA component (Ntr-type)